MFKISSKKSIYLSIAMSVLLFIGILAGVVFMPRLINILVSLKYDIEAFDAYTAVQVLSYLILVIIALADTLLFALLLRVRAELVFTSQSVALVRYVSWCAIALGIVFAALGVWFFISFALAFLCIFLGLCLRVVKNVIEQATEIKCENDFTV